MDIEGHLERLGKRIPSKAQITNNGNSRLSSLVVPRDIESGKSDIKGYFSEDSVQHIIYEYMTPMMMVQIGYHWDLSPYIMYLQIFRRKQRHLQVSSHL